MKKVAATKVVTALEALESPLPAEIQAALGELVGAAREGLLALSGGGGLGVGYELMGREGGDHLSACAVPAGRPRVVGAKLME